MKNHASITVCQKSPEKIFCKKRIAYHINQD